MFCIVNTIHNNLKLIMTLSLKKSSIFAAVAISLFSAFIIIAQTPLYDNVILSVDKYFVLSYVCKIGRAHV